MKLGILGFFNWIVSCLQTCETQIYSSLDRQFSSNSQMKRTPRNRKTFDVECHFLCWLFTKLQSSVCSLLIFLYF